MSIVTSDNDSPPKGDHRGTRRAFRNYVPFRFSYALVYRHDVDLYGKLHLRLCAVAEKGLPQTCRSVVRAWHIIVVHLDQRDLHDALRHDQWPGLFCGLHLVQRIAGHALLIGSRTMSICRSANSTIPESVKALIPAAQQCAAFFF